MSFSPAVRAELIEELQELEREREKRVSEIDSRIAAIKLLLGPATPARNDMPPSKSNDFADVRESGLREALFAVFEMHPRGLKPKQASSILEKMGYRIGGKTPLSNRVTNELWRMKRDKYLKSEKGVYKLASRKDETKDALTTAVTG